MASLYFDLGWYRACEEVADGSYMSFRFQFSHMPNQFGVINMCLPDDCNSQDSFLPLVNTLETKVNDVLAVMKQHIDFDNLYNLVKESDWIREADKGLLSKAVGNFDSQTTMIYSVVVPDDDQKQQQAPTAVLWTLLIAFLAFISVVFVMIPNLALCCRLVTGGE